MIFIILFEVLFFIIIFFRILLWLSILQKKEYRKDRLIQYLKTTEGKKDLYRTFYFQNFRLVIKRPQITLRAIGMFMLILMLLGKLRFFFFTSTLVFAQAHMQLPALVCAYLFTFLLLYTIIPLLALLVSALFSLPIYILKYYFLLKAQKKVSASRPKIIGITGSYGKSSTRHLLAQLLRQKYHVSTPDRSINTSLGTAQWLLRHYQGEEIVILEYGAYAKGEIKLLASYFKPQIAVITGLTKQHLGLFGNYTALIKAKTELLEGLAKDGAIYYNADNQDVALMIQSFLKNSKVHAYAYSAGDLSFDSDIPLIKGTYKGIEFQTTLFGSHYRENIAGAVRISADLGVGEKSIVEALNSFSPQNGYITSYRHSTGAQIIDDSKTANPQGVKAALNILGEIKGRKKIIVFGGIVDLGSESDTIHHELASYAKNIIDCCCYVGDIGKTQWQEVLGEKCITDQSVIMDTITNLAHRQVVLLEGFIPMIYLKKCLKDEKK